MRLMICGGRDFADYDRVKAALDKVSAKYDIDFLFHGGCRGADMLADKWAKENGVPHCRWDACWDYFKGSAGPKRNSWMVYYMKPTHCIAFPGGRGTKDAVSLAKECGAKVWEIAL